MSAQPAARPPRVDRFADCHHTGQVLLCGNNWAGKEALLNHYFDNYNYFTPENRATLMGIDWKHKRLQLRTHLVRLQVWLVTQEPRGLASSLDTLRYRHQYGIITFAYDVTRERSFAGVRDWLEWDRRVVEHRMPNIARLLVACKIDRADRVVDSAGEQLWWRSSVM